MDSTGANLKYLTLMGASLVATCALAAGFNLLVDPYGLFGSPRISGFNALKPAAPDRIRYTKAYYADRMMPRTIIAGNSRPEMGLDPSSRCWDVTEQPVFNAGIPGADLSDQIAYIEHVIAIGHVRSVLLGLDFFDFFVDSAATPDYSAWPGSLEESRINLRAHMDGTPNTLYSFHRLRDWLTGLFSLEALADSISTVARQDIGHSATRRPDGFNPAYDYLPIIQSEGQAVLFAQKNQEVIRTLIRRKRAIYQGANDWSWTFETLRRFISRAKDRRIDVMLFINPYHAEYLAAIAITDRWDLLEQWKRTLVNIADEEHINLWDFNVFDARTEEPPPPSGDRATQLLWFWEPSHYRREYGEEMLASALMRNCAYDEPQHLPTRTGTLITPSNIDSHLATLRAGLKNYLDDHPESISRLEGARSELRHE